jgi:CRP-like cAMP-binding protein
MPAPVFDQGSLVLKLQRTTELGEDERAALMALPWQKQQLAAGKPIVRRGDKPTRCFLVMDGFVNSVKATENGLEAVTSVHMAGDMPDLFGLYLEVMDIDMRTASPSEIAFVDHAAVKQVCAAYPKINGAFWRMTLVDAAVLREWIVNVGHRSAVSRLAHFFCEIMLRQNEVERVSNWTCALPFTQVVLGEVTGMSVVHLNRSLQELRGEKLVKFNGQTLQILDFEGLVARADFQADYLHLPSKLR